MNMSFRKNFVSLVCVVFLLALVVGCGGGDKEQAAEEAADATVVVVHDCDGDCGMTDVSVDEMTVVDGKYYCAGCAKKIEDHSGHDHN